MPIRLLAIVTEPAYLCFAMRVTANRIPIRMPDGKTLRAKVTIVPHVCDLKSDLANLADDLANLVRHCTEFGTPLNLSELHDLQGNGFSLGTFRGAGGVWVFTFRDGRGDAVSVWIDPEN